MKNLNDAKYPVSLSVAERAQLTGISPEDIRYFDKMGKRIRSSFNLESVYSLLSDVLFHNYHLLENQNLPSTQKGFPTFCELIAKQQAAIFWTGIMLDNLTNSSTDFAIDVYETHQVTQEQIEQILHDELNKIQDFPESSLSYLVGVSEWLVHHTLFIQYALDDETYIENNLFNEGVDLETIRRIISYTIYSHRLPMVMNSLPNSSIPLRIR
jgi:hypothetical protein